MAPADMAAIHRDDVSAPAPLFQAALADVAPASANAGAVRDIVLGWDARMSPASAGASCYSRLRWALASIVGSRSGLPDATEHARLLPLPASLSAPSPPPSLLP